MSNNTSLFERELVAHLIKKYQTLVEMYPPKSRILGVDRRRLEGAARTTSERQKDVEGSICTLGTSPRI
jgi:hypothetical protein